MQGRQSCLVTCVRTERSVIACLQMHRTQGIQLRANRIQGMQRAQLRNNRTHRTQIKHHVRLNATVQYLTQGHFLLMGVTGIRRQSYPTLRVSKAIVPMCLSYHTEEPQLSYNHQQGNCGS